MKNTFWFFLLCMIAGLTITGCSKKDGHGESVFSKLPGAYAVTGVTLRTGSGPEQDLFADTASCKKDNVYILNADHTFHYEDAGELCPDDPDYDDVWLLEDNDTGINIAGKDYTIGSFNGTLLTLTQSGASGGVSYVYTVHFSKLPAD